MENIRYANKSQITGAPLGISGKAAHELLETGMERKSCIDLFIICNYLRGGNLFFVRSDINTGEGAATRSHTKSYRH